MVDLATLLERAAPQEVGEPDRARIARRGQLLRKRRWAAVAAAPVTALAVIVIAATVTSSGTVARHTRVRAVNPAVSPATPLPPPIDGSRAARPGTGPADGHGGGGAAGSGGRGSTGGSPPSGGRAPEGGASSGSAPSGSSGSHAAPSLLLSSPYAATPETRIICTPSTVSGGDPTCSRPSFDALPDSGVLRVGTPSDPFVVTSPGNGTMGTSGWGDALAALHIDHRLSAPAATVQVTFDYTVQHASVTYQGAGDIAADFRLYGELKGCDDACYASNQVLVLNSTGLPSYQGSIDQPRAFQVVVSLTAPNGGVLPAGTALQAGAIVDGSVGFQTFTPYWTGRGTAEGRVTLDRVTFSV